jgi:hypothetical protein
VGTASLEGCWVLQIEMRRGRSRSREREREGRMVNERRGHRADLSVMGGGSSRPASSSSSSGRVQKKISG